MTSWRIVNGSEVVYIRPDTALEEGQPIRHAALPAAHVHHNAISVSYLRASACIPLCAVAVSL